MRVLYQWPNPSSVYAGRTIAHGYRNAWNELGHEFRFLTADDNSAEILESFEPDIFMTGLNALNLRFLDLSALKRAKKRGTFVTVNLPFWTSPFSDFRISEAGSLKSNKEWVSLIASEDYGDLYHNICESDDPRMDGFTQETGKKCETLLLAADSSIIFPEYSKNFAADLNYVGTNLPEKRSFFLEVIEPLKAKYDIRFYGQDWTLFDRWLNFAQKVGQYGNIPVLKSIRPPSLNLEDERKIYHSSQISINVHEKYQRTYGDLNERTFKIPLAGGFEIVDDVPSLSKYFDLEKELVVAHDAQDWHEKIEHYLTHPSEKKRIIEAGMKKVQRFHTYQHRVRSLVQWYKAR